MSSDAQFVAGNWRTRLEAALSADNGVRFVRYEDLVRNPHGVIRKILGDLNLSFEMSTVAAKCLDGTNVAGLVDREWHRLALEEVSTKHLDKWGSALSIDNVRTIERECGELMRRFGYQPGAYDG